MGRWSVVRDWLGAVLALLAVATTWLAGAPEASGQTIAVPEAPHVVGERVVVEVADAPGSGRDRVGIYPADVRTHDEPLYWQYLQGGRQPGASGPTDARLVFLPMSLPRGLYEARLFVNDAGRPVRVARFEIVEAGPAAAPAPRGELTVMSFNIWVNGSRGFGGIDEVARFIVSTGADVIALQESSGDTTNAILDRLRREPAYADAQASPQTAIISRYPIVQAYTAGLKGSGVKIALPDGLGAPGEHVRVFNSHLTPFPYGPYTLRDGGSIDRVLADEHATRGREMERILLALVEHRGHEPGLTTILMGDHNCPSHLDWTEANREQNFGEVIAWPVSTMLHDAGFTDSYRVVHPDPVAHRALTWSPGYPKGQLNRDDVHDRIDMVYHRAAAKRALTPVQAYTIDRDPWPSDHRAVVVSYDYTVLEFTRNEP